MIVSWSVIFYLFDHPSEPSLVALLCIGSLFVKYQSNTDRIFCI